MSEPQQDPHRGKRRTLRVLGVLVLLAGAFLTITGLADFFGGFNAMDTGGDAGPGRFWMAFVGLPLLAVGGWLLQPGFLGAVSSYVADETAPAAGRLGAAFNAGQARPFCGQCGRPTGAGARFCEGCGAALR